VTLPAAEIVEVEPLLQTIGAALIAGVGIALILSMAILGLARAGARRDGRGLAAAGGRRSPSLVWPAPSVASSLG
jgi:hypothetical protein